MRSRYLIYLQQLKWLPIILLISCTKSTSAQTDSTVSFSLREAMDYATQNNINVLNAKLDLLIADKKVWETTAIGLPQANLSGSYNNNLSLATQLLPALFFGGEEGEFVEVQFGTQHNFSGGLNISQLLFDGTYIVGLQTAKVYKQLSADQLSMTIQDIRETIATTYHAILLAKDNKTTLEKNLELFNEIVHESERYFEQGFIDKTEVTKLQVTQNSLSTSLKSITRQIDYLIYLLKIQMGLQPYQQLILTEDLSKLNKNINQETLLSAAPNASATLNYQLLNTQKELSRLELKKEKATVLPSLSMFYNYQYNAMRNEFNPFASDEKWFSSSMLGFQLSVPIFASGQKWAKIKQAQMGVSKAQNTLLFLEQTLPGQWLQLRSNYLTAHEKTINNLQNKALAREVLNQTIIKHKKGMASSMELNQANQAFLDAHAQYTAAVAELLNAKIALEKLANTL